MFYDILDQRRQQILPLLKVFQGRFYLAGGTALALQIGHRDSIDIACMKLSAITGRATQKDYVDLYFLLQDHSLPELLLLAARKFPDLDTNLILKSLVYFDDVLEEPIMFKGDSKIAWTEVQFFLRREVRKL